MPAILTHDFFGRDALDTVSSQVSLLSKDAHDAFLLGNQGPDPLFYLIIDPSISKQSRVGELMHHARPAKLLASLHDALSMLTKAERPVGEAYAAGFLCHYLLDTSVHPQVYATQYALCDAGIEELDRSDGSIVHAEIERDLDEMVLFEKRHETVATFRPYREVLRASDATLAIIDKLFFYMNLWTYSRTLELNTYTHAVKSFRVMQRAFYSPKGKLSSALGVVDRLTRHKRYSLVKAMSHRDRASADSPFANQGHAEWTNPFTGDASTESFWDLYEEALGRVFDAEALFFSDAFDEAAAEELTGNRNFSGQLVDPESVDEPEE